MAGNKSGKGTAAIIRTLIQRFARQPEADTKISVADFLRLLSDLKEVEDEKGIREVRVTWVEKDKAAH